MKKLLQSLFVLLFFASTAIAQDRTITGTVTSSDDKLPIPGVSVRVTGTQIGTVTDANGKYSVKIPSGSNTLDFSFIGYLTQSKSVGSASLINVVMMSDSKVLGEVVVTALGISREAKSLGYSASVIKSDQLTDARSTNVLNSLAGKAPGVRINSQSGTLGGSTKIVIRGVNSLGVNSPLFVIDGVPVTDGTSAGGTAANNVDFGNRIGDLSSDDIESMTILKGAAATALYGSRAKDGAIIITSKRGASSSRTSISVNSSARFENPLVLPEFQNEYAQGIYNTTTKTYDYGLKYSNGWGPKIADVQNQKFQDFLGRQVTLQAYPNNVKDFFNTGASYTNNISIAGGGDNSDYRLSFTSVNEKGIIPESKLGKYNFSVNAGRKFSDKLSSRFVASYTRINADGRPSQSSNNTNVITSAIYGLPRVVDINDVRDNVIDANGKQIFLTTDRTGNNPYWIMNYNRTSNTVDRFLGSYTFEYKPFSWMTVSNVLGGDIYTEKRGSVTRKGTAGINNGAFTNTDIFQRQINDDLLVSMEQNNLIKDFKFKLVVGGNINERSSQSTVVNATDLTIDQLYNYSNAVKAVPTLGYSKRRLMGLYGSLSASYKDFLYLDVTGRNDWTSTLPVNNRSYFYPSVSGSFIFTELLKDQNLDWLSYGKLRASWASVGSDLLPYKLDFQYDPVTTIFLQYVGAQTAIFPIGNISTAFSGPRILPNAALVPEKQNSYEFGTELKFLKNRIGLDFSYYNTRTKNQLIDIDVAISTGYFAKTVNVGAIRNRGIEVALNLVPLKARDFSWDITANFSKNKQVVEALAPGLNQYSLSSGWSGLQIKAEVDQSFGLYGLDWQKDPNGNIVIDAASGLKIPSATAQRLGNIYPDWMLGLNNQFRYKNFSLSGLIDFRQGGVFYSGTVANLRTSGLAIETGGDRTPIVDKGVNLVNGQYVTNKTAVRSMQDYWGNEAAVANTIGNIFDASYVKLREVRFSYAFPANLLKKTVFKSAEIGIEGRNLWLIKSHVPHVDPEMNFFGAGVVGEGVEFNSIPSTRSFGFNLRFGL
ncbi:SusC/RagA family TonB-linked outer membrane protein [uncultured Pedobacter sp.]|uniref:SusC/RagA family TonB-linked outer membrane protein n=1 Tax=uncultured Pedobacter sp. TaxID=246139 RepID=UPI0025EC8005|nr:SusC/RagA family TonB-linked outer membrane protein [uncultured Pedobacter sp.]